jgi:hypothetical protein
VQKKVVALAIISAVLAALLAALVVNRDMGISLQELRHTSAKTVQAAQNSTSDSNNNVNQAPMTSSNNAPPKSDRA